MANSKYEYVKTFEQSPRLLPNTYIVVRLDGRGFHKLCAKYMFEKPNDRHALELMNAAAAAVISDLHPDVVLAYGVSDEFSFVLGRGCKLFERRESKILTTVVSTFTSYYVNLWPSFFPAKTLSSPLPSFDGRVVLYPSLENLWDYLKWRQVDCHINNLYNTTFWALQQRGDMKATEAEKALKGTQAKEKNEILFSRFQVNYNSEPPLYKKGSLLYYNKQSKQPKPLKLDPTAAASLEILDGPKAETTTTTTRPGQTIEDSSTSRIPSGDDSETTGPDWKQRTQYMVGNILVEHTDMIHRMFWEGKGWILEC